MLTKLKSLLKLIAANADHFCKPENKGQLDWIMWRWVNIFYSARIIGKGYDDSIMYFLDSFSWDDKLSQVQKDVIQTATCSYQKMAQFGYIDTEFMMDIYIADIEKIQELENSIPSNLTLLIAKEKKTYTDHLKIQSEIYKNISKPTDDFMILTYYSGYSFKNGFLENEDCINFDPLFIYKWKDVPKKIMSDLLIILNDKKIINCQNKARKIWEKDKIESFKSQFYRVIPEEFKDKTNTFSLAQWIFFGSKLLKQGFDSLKKEKEFKLILGINPIINKIDKNSDQSYIDACIDLCNKVLNSKESLPKDIKFAKDILKKFK